MNPAEHHCHAEDCAIAVPPRMFMHRAHWFMVPSHLRTALWKEYQPGQERRKNPTGAYCVAAERCICAVAVKEGRIDQAEADRRIAHWVERAAEIDEMFGHKSAAEEAD